MTESILSPMSVSIGIGFIMIAFQEFLRQFLGNTMQVVQCLI